MSASAYGDLAAARSRVAAAGFVTELVRVVEGVDHAQQVASVAHVYQSPCGRVVVVAYRGGELTSATSWQADANDDRTDFATVGPAGTPANLTVHAGFVRGFQATWDGVRTALGRAARGERIDLEGKPEGKLPHPMTSLYLTGHGTGGAMAALAGLWCGFDDVPSLCGVYTFGQPMIGSPSFAQYARERIGKLLFRHVYRDDIVPHLPPRFGLARFSHFGAEWRAAQPADWRRSRMKSHQVFDAVLGSVAIPWLVSAVERIGRRLPLLYSWHDHSPAFYLDVGAAEPVAA
jgi:hypothetical protein